MFVYDEWGLIPSNKQAAGQGGEENSMNARKNSTPKQDLTNEKAKIDKALDTLKKEWTRVADGLAMQVAENPYGWQCLGPGGDVHELRAKLEEVAGMLSRWQVGKKNVAVRWVKQGVVEVDRSLLREDNDRQRIDFSIEVSDFGKAAMFGRPEVIEVPGVGTFKMYRTERDGEGDVRAWEYVIDVAHIAEAMEATLTLFND